MKLISFEVTPRGSNGWSTGLLDLNNPILVLQAPNGTGKTPILKCLMYGLGLHIPLPIEIINFCSEVAINLSFKDKLFKIKRQISDDFEVSVFDEQTTEVSSFSNEADYSAWLISMMGFPDVELTSRSRTRAQLYSTIILSLFWVDQDRGWSKTYFSEKDFIWDQEEELTRLLLGIPIRHPFSQRSDFEKAKAELKAIESRMEIVQRATAQEKRDLGEESDTSIDLVSKEIEQLKVRVEMLASDLTSTKRIASAFDDRIIELKRELSTILSEKHNLETTVARFSSVENELSAEIEILGTNVSAAKAFRTFCGGEKCKLFASSEASYGKRLLYLADQIKDIQREVNGLSSRIRTLSLHEKDLSEQIKQVEASKSEALQAPDSINSMSLYQSIISRLTKLELLKGRIEKLANLRKESTRLLTDKENQKRLVENLTPGRQSRDLTGIKNSLSEKLVSWLNILGTRSLPQPIYFDDNLKIRFGDQDLRSFSGSTLIRILLAYRTALYEVSTIHQGLHPGVLIMDAPRQHEIDAVDFSNYFEAIHKTFILNRNSNIQIIISLSDQIFPASVPHSKIEPKKQHEGILKYFGPT